MEDLPLGIIAALDAWVCSEGPANGQNTDDDDEALYASCNSIRKTANITRNVFSKSCKVEIIDV